MSASETETAAVPMTPEQKFFFDLRGWILLPSVLTRAEIERMKAAIHDGAKDSYGPVLQELLDHPAIVGILTEILAEGETFAHKDCHAFRCESSFTTVRETGWSSSQRDDDGLPHVVRPPQRANPMRYQVAGGKIYSGLTQVVWELEPVRVGQGGTTFLSGSHKAHFGYGGPDPGRPNLEGSPWGDNIRAVMDDYSCPAGSVVIFSESLLHAANDWTNPDNPRCAVFNCYNSVWAQWHRMKLDPRVIEAMPPKRRTLFRGTWSLDRHKHNRDYSDDNRCL